MRWRQPRQRQQERRGPTGGFRAPLGVNAVSVTRKRSDEAACLLYPTPCSPPSTTCTPTSFRRNRCWTRFRATSAKRPTQRSSRRCAVYEQKSTPFSLAKAVNLIYNSVSVWERERASSVWARAVWGEVETEKLPPRLQTRCRTLPPPKWEIRPSPWEQVRTHRHHTQILPHMTPSEDRR